MYLKICKFSFRLSCSYPVLMGFLFLKKYSQDLITVKYNVRTLGLTFINHLFSLLSKQGLTSNCFVNKDDFINTRCLEKRRGKL